MKAWKTSLVLIGVGCLGVSSQWVFSDESAPPKAASAEAVPATGIEVLRMVLCKEVKDREPQNEISSAKVGDVVVGWTQIRSGLGDVTVTHRWVRENKTEADVPLQIKASPWRTWSKKTVGEAGNWKLQVLNSKGEVLKEMTFTVAG